MRLVITSLGLAAAQPNGSRTVWLCNRVINEYLDIMIHRRMDAHRAECGCLKLLKTNSWELNRNGNKNHSAV